MATDLYAYYGNGMAREAQIGARRQLKRAGTALLAARDATGRGDATAARAQFALAWDAAWNLAWCLRYGPEKNAVGARLCAEVDAEWRGAQGG